MEDGGMAPINPQNAKFKKELLLTFYTHYKPMVMRGLTLIVPSLVNPIDLLHIYKPSVTRKVQIAKFSHSLTSQKFYIWIILNSHFIKISHHGLKIFYNISHFNQISWSINS